MDKVTITIRYCQDCRLPYFVEWDKASRLDKCEDCKKRKRDEDYPSIRRVLLQPYLSGKQDE